MKTIFVFVCAFTSIYLNAQTVDSLQVIEKNQVQLQANNKCPVCPGNVIIKYLKLLKAGKFEEANGLVNYINPSEENDMPFLKSSIKQLKEDAGKKNKIEAELSKKLNVADKATVFYIDKETAGVSNYTTQGGTSPLLIAKKVKGQWKIVGFEDKSALSDYKDGKLKDLIKAFGVQPLSSYFRAHQINW
ncbi:MAG: hypothetical protein H0W61_01215 [Bacteroidetes bacterium]|nr:hypothetical protein [Bacteroidota bacterium]